MEKHIEINEGNYALAGTTLALIEDIDIHTLIEAISHLCELGGNLPQTIPGKASDEQVLKEQRDIIIMFLNIKSLSDIAMSINAAKKQIDFLK